MRLNLIKIFFIILFALYQSAAYSKKIDKNEFNQRYLSNYFSALVSYDNQNNEKALKFFNSSKYLLNKHHSFLKEYVFSLVSNGQVTKAIKQIKLHKNKNNSNFFEAQLLLILDAIYKKNFNNASKLLYDINIYKETSAFESIIYQTLQSYNFLFLNKEIEKINKNFGQLSLITSAFQNCYLNSDLTESHFLNLINSQDAEYSRYLFFYLMNLVENKDYDSARQISSTIDLLNNSLLVSQAKKWIEKSNFKKFNEYFSCKKETDVLSEFFFLISNLYAAEEEYEKSNFYLNISNYLNPKFYFNLSLLAENYFFNDNFSSIKKILAKFDDDDEIYYWYKQRKSSMIISELKNDDVALNYIENKFKNYKKPNIKIFFDMGNIYKNLKKYDKAIEYYSIVLSILNKNSSSYADVLYKRGSSYERLGDYKKADKDLIKSLDIVPDDPYVMNYLAYSWLERNLKIEEAVEMLERAYKQKQNDPYIIDSVGWGYYLIGDYIKAEKFLKQAVQIMPDDPIVNDHYGDILWKLGRKLQAKYFWNNVLNLKDTEEKMKKNILKKLLKGLDKT